MLHAPRPHIPIIAIIGRTNVGKSTLFNRLIEQQKALVSSIPGTTRDRNEGDCLWRGRLVRLVDTGGLDMPQGSLQNGVFSSRGHPSTPFGLRRVSLMGLDSPLNENPSVFQRSPHKNEIERDVVLQAERAMKQADLILFVVDLKAAALPQDRTLARQLKKSRKPVLVVGNKAETPKERAAATSPDWILGGLPSPIPVSALRGTGSGDLLDAVYALLTKNGTPPTDISEIVCARVAVVGKPNVGKSSLLNTLLKEERFIVSPIAHTTREPIDTLVEVNGKEYVFIDTAGMRKSNKVRKSGGLEESGVARTMHAIKRADIALFVVDASQPLASQDKTLAGALQESGVGVILVANKWDLIESKTTTTIHDFEEYIAGMFPFLRFAPVLFTSALTGQRVENILALVDDVQRARYLNIPEEELDAFFASAVRKHLPTKGKGPKPPKALGMKQIGVAPPTFTVTIQAKRTDVIHDSYLRFLGNQLHEAFRFTGTPVVVKARVPEVRAK